MHSLKYLVLVRQSPQSFLGPQNITWVKKYLAPKISKNMCVTVNSKEEKMVHKGL